AIRGAAEGAVQRQPPSLRIQDPPGDLERRPRELIALDEGKAIQELLGGADLLPDDQRSHQRTQGVEGGGGGLRGGRRHVGRAALAPRMVALALHPDEDRLREELVAVGRAEVEGEGKLHPVDVEGVDLHAHAMVVRASRKGKRRRAGRLTLWTAPGTM